MKALIKFIAIFLVVANVVSPLLAQSRLKGHSGLYLSVGDYNIQKLSYEIDCSKESHKIKVDKLFGQSKLDIIHDGKKYSYEKKDVFGFRDCKNTDFRFFNNNEYQIVDSEFFYLYSYHIYVSNGKTLVRKPAYFISREAGSNIEPLTLENLKNFFPDNHKYHDMLDAAFKTNNDLNIYDSYHKMYSIKHLYKQSL